jgi:hypothetical protein
LCSGDKATSDATGQYISQKYNTIAPAFNNGDYAKVASELGQVTADVSKAAYNALQAMPTWLGGSGTPPTSLAELSTTQLHHLIAHWKAVRAQKRAAQALLSQRRSRATRRMYPVRVVERP